MDEFEILLEELNKPETKETVNKVVEEYNAKEKKKTDKKKKIMSGIEYIAWLIDFTKDIEGFTDNDWDYVSEKLSKEDQEKVDDLPLFFEGIYDYARKNYIYSIAEHLGECYRIRIGDIGFEIGYITGQGTAFFCKRIPIDTTTIDYIDILTNKKQDNVDFIEDELHNLSDVIMSVYNNGVPIEAIEEMINETMRSITLMERCKGEKSKKLTKKK